MTNDNNLAIRIKAFENEIKHFCPYTSSIELKYDLSQEKHYVKLFMNSDDKKLVETIVGKYDDIIQYARIYEALPNEQIACDIKRFQFNYMEGLIVQNLINFIDSVKTHPHNREIYCLNVWIDTGNSCIDFHVNNEKEFNQRLKDKQSGEVAGHYSSISSVLNYRFYLHTTFSGEASDELNDLLQMQNEIIYENYRRYGEPYLTRITNHYERLFVRHVANAINKTKAKMSELNITGDFVAFIRFYDEDNITHYHALCETVDFERIKSTFGELYLDFLT